MIDYSKYWTNQKSAYNEALSYIYNRQKGNIKSFKTPWAKVNDAGVNGFEWHNMVVVAGRPGSGKTLLKDQIVRESYTHNAGAPMNILEFQLEMVAKASKVREFSSVIGKSYKYICSADPIDKITDYELNQLIAHSKRALDVNNNPVDIVEKPVTVEVVEAIIHAYMKQHAQIINDKTVYINTLITLDHSLLLKKSAHHKTKTDMLYELGETITKLKRIYPILFIILSQLGREVERPERNEEGKYGNYILDSDIFGGDALMQHADIVIGLNRPGNKFIKYYGPQRYIIEDDSIIVFHFLKCRNGDSRMSFFKAEFDKMRIVEIETPGQQQRR